MPRILAIGDIHGSANALRTLLNTIKPQPDDIIVTLGDYINKGPDSKGVIEQLINLSKICTLIPLKGNHDLILIDEDGAEKYMDTFEGETTLESYGVSRIADIPAEHLAFLRSCQAYYEADQHFFVHASVDASTPLTSQSVTSLLWTHVNEAPALHMSGKLMICGHTPQPNHKPTHWGTAICIDTGAVNPGGWLTCLEVRSGACRYSQANEAGQSRMDVLLAPEEDD